MAVGGLCDGRVLLVQNGFLEGQLLQSHLLQLGLQALELRGLGLDEWVVGGPRGRDDRRDAVDGQDLDGAGLLEAHGEVEPRHGGAIHEVDDNLHQLLGLLAGVDIDAAEVPPGHEGGALLQDKRPRPASMAVLVEGLVIQGDVSVPARLGRLEDVEPEKGLGGLGFSSARLVTGSRGVVHTASL